MFLYRRWKWKKKQNYRTTLNRNNNETVNSVSNYFPIEKHFRLIISRNCIVINTNAKGLIDFSLNGSKFLEVIKKDCQSFKDYIWCQIVAGKILPLLVWKLTLKKICELDNIFFSTSSCCRLTSELVGVVVLL